MFSNYVEDVYLTAPNAWTRQYGEKGKDTLEFGKTHSFWSWILPVGVHEDFP